jgi:hypothetical protein
MQVVRDSHQEKLLYVYVTTPIAIYKFFNFDFDLNLLMNKNVFMYSLEFDVKVNP